MNDAAKSDPQPGTSATARLLEAPDDTASLLPALTTLTERAIATWQDDLCVAMSQQVQVKIYKTTIDKAHFFARKVSPQGASALVRIDTWDHPIVIGATRDLVFSCVDALFGGDGSEPPVQTERALSQIELDLMSHVFALLAEALQSSFEGIIAEPFAPLPAVGDLHLEDGGLEDCAMVGCVVTVDVSGQHNQALLCFPQSELGAISDKMRDALATAPPRDPEWATRFSGEVVRTPLEVLARMDAGRMMLGKLAQLKVGDVLAIPAASGSLIEMICNDLPLMRCQLDQTGGRVQLTVDHFVNSQAGESVSAGSANETPGQQVA